MTSGQGIDALCSRRASVPNAGRTAQQMRAVNPHRDLSISYPAEPLNLGNRLHSCTAINTVEPQPQHQSRCGWIIAKGFTVMGRFVVVTEQQITGMQPQVVAKAGMVEGGIEAVEGP